MSYPSDRDDWDSPLDDDIYWGDDEEEEDDVGEWGEEDDDIYWGDDEEWEPDSFADPGGESALRAATRNNPRNLPCPTCKQPNLLTPKDVARGYQCDRCARRDEGGLVSWGEY